MKMKSGLLCLIFGILIASAGNLAAQEPRRVYTGSLRNIQFNYNQPSARAIGLGGAFVAIADDATACEANPAGLTSLLSPEMATHLRFNLYSHSEIAGNISDIEKREDLNEKVLSLSYLSMVYPFPEKGVSISFYRQELINFRTSYEIIGFQPQDGPNFTPTGWGPGGEIAKSTFNLTNWGGALAYMPHPTFSLGFALRVSVGDLRANSRTFWDYSEEFNRYSGENWIGNQQGSNKPENELNSQILDMENEIGVGFTAGVILRPVDFLSIGAVYRRYPSLEIFQSGTSHYINDPEYPADPWQLAGGSSSSFDIKLPDSYGVGISLAPTDWLTLACDVVQIKYSHLLREIGSEALNIELDDSWVDEWGTIVEDPDGVVDQAISDITEFHMGAEITKPAGSTILSFRGGYYLEPEHNIRYTGTKMGGPYLVDDFLSDNYFVDSGVADLQRALPEGEDQHHVTAGFGCVFNNNRIMMDAAVNFSGNTSEFLFSTVVRF